MKKTLLVLAILGTTLLTSCENWKTIGNHMNKGSYTYYYAYVDSSLLGKKYYHIDGWKEYGPDGVSLGEGGGTLGNYVGLELHLFTSKDVIYFWEQNLQYVLSKEYNPELGEAIE